MDYLNLDGDSENWQPLPTSIPLRSVPAPEINMENAPAPPERDILYDPDADKKDEEYLEKMRMKREKAQRRIRVKGKASSSCTASPMEIEGENQNEMNIPAAPATRSKKRSRVQTPPHNGNPDSDSSSANNKSENSDSDSDDYNSSMSSKSSMSSGEGDQKEGDEDDMKDDSWDDNTQQFTTSGDKKLDRQIKELANMNWNKVPKSSSKGDTPPPVKEDDENINEEDVQDDDIDNDEDNPDDNNNQFLSNTTSLSCAGCFSLLAHDAKLCEKPKETTKSKRGRNNRNNKNIKEEKQDAWMVWKRDICKTGVKIESRVLEEVIDELGDDLRSKIKESPTSSTSTTIGVTNAQSHSRREVLNTRITSNNKYGDDDADQNPNLGKETIEVCICSACNVIVGGLVIDCEFNDESDSKKIGKGKAYQWENVLPSGMGLMDN